MQVLVLVLLGALLTGCSKCGTSGSAPKPEGSVTLRGAEAARSAIHSDGAAPSAQRPEETSTEATHAFGQASNAFAVDLYAKLRKGSTNLAFSPASIAMALTMTWAGARGDTAAQMARVLHLPEPEASVHIAASSLIRRWNEPRPDTYQLRVVSRLFGSRGHTLVPSFVDTTKRYGAELEPLDFQGHPDLARTHINGWVHTATNQRIRDFVPPGGITSQTALVLTNAAYFLGRWARRDNRDDTLEQPFYLSDRRTVKVPLMQQMQTFGYARVPQAQVLEMRHAGDDLAMTVVLPDRRYGLAELESSLSLEALRHFTDDVRPQLVKVAFPRFRVDPPSAFSVRGALSSLGMGLAFTPQADFRGMCANAPVMIDDVYHKAFVELDEDGTEAAAATAAGVVPGATTGSPPPLEFRADHPFLFFIRAIDSGAILFLGRVNDPSHG